MVTALVPCQFYNYGVCIKTGRKRIPNGCISLSWVLMTPGSSSTVGVINRSYSWFVLRAVMEQWERCKTPLAIWKRIHLSTAPEITVTKYIWYFWCFTPTIWSCKNIQWFQPSSRRNEWIYLLMEPARAAAKKQVEAYSRVSFYSLTPSDFVINEKTLFKVSWVSWLRYYE
jgi:hypothetical protein